MNPNTIYCGDCVEVLSRFKDESVDLIYIDPPFFSGKNYAVIWGDEKEVRAFKDRWKGGSKGIHTYIKWMEPRIRECHRVLKPTGSMYLHCDWHANAHLRILMDRIFGIKNFQNEIVWCYRTGGATKKRFSRKHDTIFFYTKSNKWLFNLEKERVYYDKAFFVSEKDESGRYYADVLPVDFWEIPAVINVSKERLGYPTQKPEALLERIIKASSNPNDMVLDPMCGCGTAIAVAQKLKRQWVGIDVSPTACELMVKRMQTLGFQIKVEDIVGLPKTLKEIKALEWSEFQNWACKKLGGKGNLKKVHDMGIDGWMKDGSPIQVKQHEVGRKVIDEFQTAMRRAKQDKGIIVGYKFAPSVYNERDRASLEDGLEIELKTAQNLLNGKFDGDKYHPLKKHQIPKEDEVSE